MAFKEIGYIIHFKKANTPKGKPYKEKMYIAKAQAEKDAKLLNSHALKNKSGNEYIVKPIFIEE